MLRKAGQRLAVVVRAEASARRRRCLHLRVVIPLGYADRDITYVHDGSYQVRRKSERSLHLFTRVGGAFRHCKRGGFNDGDHRERPFGKLGRTHDVSVELPYFLGTAQGYILVSWSLQNGRFSRDGAGVQHVTLGAVQGRNDWYTHAGAAEAVLDDGALSDSAALLAEILDQAKHGKSIKVGLLHAVCRLHFYRFQANRARGSLILFDAYVFYLVRAILRHRSLRQARKLPEALTQSAQWLNEVWGTDEASPLGPDLKSTCRVFGSIAAGHREYGIAVPVLSLITILAPEAGLVRAASLSLAGLHYVWYQRSANPELLRHAITSLAPAVDFDTLSPHDTGPVAKALDLMGTARYLWFQYSEDLEDLVTAAAYHMWAVERCDDGAVRVEYLDKAGATHSKLATVRRDAQHLALAIDCYQQALSLAAPGSAARSTVVAHLWYVLGKSRVVGDGPCLDRSITLGQSLMGNDDVSPKSSYILAGLFYTRLLLASQPDRVDIDASVELMTRAQLALPQEHDDWPIVTSDLAAVLATRYEYIYDIGDLDRAIELFGLVLTRTEPGDEVRTSAETMLTMARRRRAGAGGARRVPPPSRTPALQQARELFFNFEQSGSPLLLDEAIGALEGGASGASGDHPDFAAERAFHGHLLHVRFVHYGNAADLVASTERLREAVRAAPDEAGFTAELGMALRTRFEQGHGIDHLNESIRLQERVLPIASPSSRMIVLNTLGQSLRRRYEHSKYLADLTAAVDRLSEAVAAEGSDIDRASCHNNLGSVYYHLHFHTGALSALLDAVEHHRAAVRITPSTHVARSVRLDNLAGSLCQQYLETLDAALLNEAVRHTTEAVNATPSSSPERAKRLDGLGRAMMLRYNALRNPTDLETAIRYQAAAARAIRSGSLHEAQILVSYAKSLLSKYVADRQPSDLATAIETLARARDLETSLVHYRADAARHLAMASAFDPRLAAGHARSAFDLVGAADWHSLPVADQAALVREWAGFACRAADWAIAAEEPREAVELLEQGRGIIWGHVTTRQTDLTALTAARPDLADRFIENNSVGRSGSVTGELIATANLVRRHVIAEIRNVDGFANFMGTPSLDDMADAMAGGPVVYLNVTEQACTAIIVRPDLEIDLEVLRGCDLATVSTKTREFLDAMRTLQQAYAALLVAKTSGQQPRKATLIAFHTAADVVRTTLEWGWTAISEPVLTRALGGAVNVGFDGLTWDRMWWCPTGPLTQFPLHATGYHDRPGHSVIDRIVYSETSTLRMLADAHRRARAGTLVSGMLAVGVAATAQRRDILRGVQAELDAVRAASSMPTTYLEGPSATRENVLARLPSHQWFHFAGHASTSVSDSSNAALLAEDQEISLADLADLALTGAELAFLSVCHGVDVSPLHADEALHLAGVAQAIGFRHVVAARSKIDDDTACRVAAGFYRQLRTTPDPAVALHRVLCQLRAELRAAAAQSELINPFAWIHHTHSGPTELQRRRPSC